jgi:PAS domain S-box-containing protein
MDYQDKTREEFIKALHELQLENESLKALHNKNISELKKTGKALQESEENYRLLLDLAPNAFFQGDHNGNIIMANSTAALLTGYSKEKLLTMNLKDLFPSSILTQKPLRYDLLNQGEIITGEREIIRQDGSIVTIEMNSRKMPNNTYQSFMRDISERKQSEAALRDSEYLYRAVFENTGSSSIIIEEDTTIALTNTEWVKLAGYTREEMEGKMKWTEFVVPEDLERMKEYHKKRRSDPEGAPRNYEFRFRRRNGEIRNIFLCVAMIPESNRSIASLMDITDRKKVEETLRENEEKLQTIIETSPDGIAISSLEGVVRYVTKNIVSTWGYDSPEEIVGRNVMEFIHPEYREKAVFFMNELINGKFTTSSEYVMLRKDGSTFYCESKANILRDANNNPIGLLYVNRDTTQRKKEEIELIKAKEKAEESDRLKSAFLANMSHEIRTPMNGILGFADLLKQPQLTGEEQQEYIRIIEKSGARMLNILNDIIDISKIEAGLMKITLSETNINEQIEYIHNFFSPETEKKGLSFLVKQLLPSEEARIKTDREKIYAIMTNLIKNAIKFTDNGFIELGYNKKGEFIEFFIKDTGMGIAKDRQHAVFERFIQADINDRHAFQGAGLGLSITKAYVEMLGGQIWFESKENEGSVFYFTIPYKVASERDNDTEVKFEKKQNSNINKIKVLIAEDDEISDLFLTIFLEKYDCDLMHVKTGADAVETCRNNPDIDLVIMDIKMPEMNGYDATEKIRQFNKKVIIIAQTAFALTGDKEKAIEAGCNDYIAKPLNQASLSALIRKYFYK